MSRQLLPFDEEYPRGLYDLPKTPPPLFVRGHVPAGPAVAVVGTRAPSAAAQAYAFDLGAQLASAGFCVWSGGAAGVDAAAHEGALSVRGPTVLVAGAGLDIPYPVLHGPLFRRIEQAGALVGLLPDGTRPRPWTFLARNHVLAAATVCTVVVECPLKSGARSTSAAARRLGRPLWIVAQPPWSPCARTVDVEVRLGARPLFQTDELFAFLQTLVVTAARPPRLALVPAASQLPLLPPAAQEAPTVRLPAPAAPAIFPPLRPPADPLTPSLSDKARRLLDFFDAHAPSHLDVLCERSGWAAAEVHPVLLHLVLGGWVQEAEPGRFVRISLGDLPRVVPEKSQFLVFHDLSSREVLGLPVIPAGCSDVMRGKLGHGKSCVDDELTTCARGG